LCFGRTVAQQVEYHSFSDPAVQITNRYLVSGVVFDRPGAWRVTPKSTEALKVIADFLVKHQSIVIEIGVHTDERGSDEFNTSLSQRYADALKSLLVEQFGIRTDRIETKGYGESQPIISEETISQAIDDQEKEILYLKNWRIEIIVLKI